MTLRAPFRLADYLSHLDVTVIPGTCFGLALVFRIFHAAFEQQLTTASIALPRRAVI